VVGMGSDKVTDISIAQMKDLIVTMMWFWGGIHFKWRRAVEDEYGFDAVLKLELKFIGDVGKSHAKRFKKIFNIRGGISGFMEAFRFAPENFVEQFEIMERSDKHIMFCNRACSVQKAMMELGKGEFPCKEIGTLYFISFAREIDPNINVSCIVCPPDQHPDDLFCKWKVEIT